MMHIARHSNRRVPRRAARAFSLLETIIAMGVLGIGLIMIAAVFPVALTEHRESTDRAGSLELTSKAQAILAAKIGASQLWSPSTAVDSDIYLLPFANLAVGGGWDTLTGAPIYANLLDLAPTGAGNEIDLLGADIISDRFPPFDDNQAEESAGRFVWYGFYRRLANGKVTYTIAVCRANRGQVYGQQNHGAMGNGSMLPQVDPDPTIPLRRLPAPWRVQVGRFADPVSPSRGLLYNDSNPESLSELAPPGSKILVAGFTTSDTGPYTLSAVGRLLTVTDVIDAPLPQKIEVLEDISDIRPHDPADSSYPNATFAVWVFPPALVGGTTADEQFGRRSPVVEWKVLQ